SSRRSRSRANSPATGGSTIKKALWHPGVVDATFGFIQSLSGWVGKALVRDLGQWGLWVTADPNHAVPGQQRATAPPRRTGADEGIEGVIAPRYIAHLDIAPGGPAVPIRLPIAHTGQPDRPFP